MNNKEVPTYIVSEAQPSVSKHIAIVNSSNFDWTPNDVIKIVPNSEVMTILQGVSKRLMKCVAIGELVRIPILIKTPCPGNYELKFSIECESCAPPKPSNKVATIKLTVLASNSHTSYSMG